MNLSLMLTVILTISMTAVVVILTSSDSKVYAVRESPLGIYSIDIPDNWAYQLNGPLAESTPREFAVFLVNQSEPLNQKMKNEGAISRFTQPLYPIYNAPFDVYVKYELDEQNAMKVMSKENVTIDGEPAVKIYADGIDSLSGIKIVEYLVMHEKEPYVMSYVANVKDYEKYLPQFEQMVKTFKFAK
jgi:hypothetical protein